VSKTDIPAGTALDPLIDQGNFTTRTVLSSSVIRSVITDTYQLRGQRTAYPVLAGEQISAARLSGALQAKGGELGIPAGYQAASVTLEEQRMVGGAPREGDHVEVWGTFSGTGTQHTTRVVIQDAEVLSAPSASNNNTVTLAVTPAEAGLLIYTQEQGHTWLTLLPPNQKGAQVPPVTSKALR
jgi:Flp pilus assembly protein CpaB